MRVRGKGRTVYHWHLIYGAPQLGVQGHLLRDMCKHKCSAHVQLASATFVNKLVNNISCYDQVKPHDGFHLIVVV